MQEISGRNPEFQVEVPKQVRDCVPARFGIEIIRPSPGEAAEYFGNQVSLLITDQFSNKFIQSSYRPIDQFDVAYMAALVKGFQEFLAKQKAA